MSRHLPNAGAVHVVCSGVVSHGEFRRAIAELGVDLSDSQVTSMLLAHDPHGTGRLDYYAMCSRMKPAAGKPLRCTSPQPDRISP